MTPPNELWIVGQHEDPTKQWQFQGVYSSQENAVAACRDANYFVARVRLDERMPHERTEWAEDEAWYPADVAQADGANA